MTPELNLYDEDWPIWTYQEQLPPAKFVFDDEDRRGMAVDSMVSGGCIISGATVRRSLLFSNVRVHSFCADRGLGAARRRRRRPQLRDPPRGDRQGLQPARRARASASIPRRTARRFHVTESGVTLVTPDMLGQQIHHLR